MVGYDIPMSNTNPPTNSFTTIRDAMSPVERVIGDALYDIRATCAGHVRIVRAAAVALGWTEAATWAAVNAAAAA